MKTISFRNKTVEIDGKAFELEYRIKNVRVVNEMAIVIYEFDENAPRHRQFQNCLALDENGEVLWIAEHPTNETADFYVDFMNSRDNRIWNFGCYICELDYSNGRLKKADFTK